MAWTVKKQLFLGAALSVALGFNVAHADFAANLAKVDLEFWAVNDSGVKVAEGAYNLYKSIGHAEENVYSILEKLEAKKFQWGESDGN